MKKVLYISENEGVILNDHEIIIISGDKVNRLNNNSLMDIVELKVLIEDWQLSDVDKDRILLYILDEFTGEHDKGEH